MLCRHCNAHKINRPRGLCWTCYHTPGVRQRYPDRRGIAIVPSNVPDRCGGYEVPLRPTSARPGTPEKLAVLMERAAAGVALWHRLDG